MGLLVPLEAGRLAEELAALCAEVGLLLCMNGALVSPEVARPGETLAALETAVGSISTWGALMGFQASLVTKTATAFMAAE